MVDMSVKIGSVTLSNPIMPASGAFSTELAQVMDINRLGALVTKTVSRELRFGNPPPRVAEVEGGMINSIGLPGKGIQYFLEHQLPDYKRYTPPIVANITATTADDFEAMAREVDVPDVDVIEMNISCPTREPGGGNFALHEDHTYEIVKRVRGATKKPLWAKLSPNAGEIDLVALAAERAGADALTISNTLLGLKMYKANHPAHGAPVLARGEDSDHRLRRHRQGRGRGRVHARRRERCHDRLPHVPQSLRHARHRRRARAVVRQARLRPRRRPHRRDDLRQASQHVRRRGRADRVIAR
jgi:hypothetical protein